MITVDGDAFQLWGLDTNVLSEMLADRGGALRRFLEQSLYGKTRGVPAISLWTILEIKRRRDVYERFLEFFSVCPLLLLKPPHQIFREEIERYPDPTGIMPVLHAFTPFNKDKDAQLRPFFRKFFATKQAKHAEDAWRSWKRASIDAILTLKPNFPPQAERYSEADASRFVTDGVPQFVMQLAPDFAQGTLASGSVIDPNAFPSVKIQFYTVFHRFYIHDKREPEDQDAFDILISSTTPYLDHVLTEKFQADIYERVQRRDSFISHLVIGTVASLRN